jgi:hypothetical protein
MAKAPRPATDIKDGGRQAGAADDPEEREPKGTPTSERYLTETTHADETPRAVHEKKKPASNTHP